MFSAVLWLSISFLNPSAWTVSSKRGWEVYTRNERGVGGPEQLELKAGGGEVAWNGASDENKKLLNSMKYERRLSVWCSFKEEKIIVGPLMVLMESCVHKGSFSFSVYDSKYFLVHESIFPGRPRRRSINWCCSMFEVCDFPCYRNVGVSLQCMMACQTCANRSWFFENRLRLR